MPDAMYRAHKAQMDTLKNLSDDELRKVAPGLEEKDKKDREERKKKRNKMTKAMMGESDG